MTEYVQQENLLYNDEQSLHSSLFKIDKVLSKRAGWTVTKMHSHYIFEPGRFKKGFQIMKQKSRQ